MFDLLISALSLVVALLLFVAYRFVRRKRRDKAYNVEMFTEPLEPRMPSDFKPP